MITIMGELSGRRAIALRKSEAFHLRKIQMESFCRYSKLTLKIALTPCSGD